MFINTVGKPEVQINNEINVTILYGYFFRNYCNIFYKKKKTKLNTSWNFQYLLQH